MSSFIFARRDLQRAIDRLNLILTADQMKSLIDRMNRPGEQRLPTMWEAVMLDALTTIGTLRYEIVLSNGRRPDFELTVPGPGQESTVIVGDVTTVSDSGLDQQNPVKTPDEEISRLAWKHGLNANHFSYDVCSDRIGSIGDVRIRLPLPDRGVLLELLKVTVEPWIRRLAADKPTADRFGYDKDGTVFTLTYNTDQQFATGGHDSYDIAASRAGDISSDEFFLAYDWKNNLNDNIFRRMLRSGQMITGVKIDRTDLRDDDWIEFSFGPPDPAISPFRIRQDAALDKKP